MADDVFRVEVGAQIGTSTERLKKDIQSILNDISKNSVPTVTVSLNSVATKKQLETSLNKIVQSLKIDLSNVSVTGTFKGNLSNLGKDFGNIADASKKATQSASSFVAVLSKNKLAEIGAQAQKSAAQITAMGAAYKAIATKTPIAQEPSSPSIVRQSMAINAEEDRKSTQDAVNYFKQAEAEKAAAAASAAASIEKSYKQSIQNVSDFYGHSDTSWWKENLTGGESASKRAITQANRLASSFNQGSAAGQEYAQKLDLIVKKYRDIPLYGKQFEEEVKKLGKEAKDAGAMAETAGQKFQRMLGTRIGYTVIASGLFAIRSALRDLYQNVVDLDSAMTELRKVTDETEETYNRFLEGAAERSQRLGSTLIDTVRATADFARLGYSLDEASELADAALVYKNVGDGIADINEASESVISTMQAFQMEASESMGVVDKFNEVGNNYAISSKGVGDALLRSAAAMAAANNTLDETIALATTANTVVQDPEKVGTTLKTLSMYLRAAKTEAEDAGESTEGMASSVSELRDEILSLTGNQVDIMIDDNTFKSSYQILKEISSVWDQLTDVTQANILEMLGGKRNANIVAALVENFDLAERVLETSMNSAGSALTENEKVLDSIAGKFSILSAAFEEFSNDVLDSELIKGFVDLLTAILNSLNDLNDATNGWSSSVIFLVTSIGIVSGVLSAFRIQLAGTGTIFGKFIDHVKTGTVISSLGGVLKSVTAQVSSFGASTVSAAASAATATGTIGGLSTALLGWVGIAAVAITTAYSLYKSYKETHKSLEELQEAYRDSSEVVSSLNDEIAANAARISELQDLYDAGSITLVEQSELEKLKTENSLLSAQLELKKAQNEADRQALQISTRDAANDFMADTPGVTTDSWGVQTDFRSEKEKIEDWIKEYQSTRERLEAAYKQSNADLADDLEKKAGDLLSSISTSSAPLSDYLSVLDPVKDADLIDEITVLSGKIRLLTGDAEAAESVLSSMMSSKTYSAAFVSLRNLANSGDFTQQSLQRLADERPGVASLVSVLEEMGLLDWDNLSALENQVKDINEVAEETAVAFSTITTSLESLTNQYDLLKEVQEEVNDRGSFSLETLKQIAETYPELEEEIALYLVGLKSEKDLISSMSAAYQTDVDNYKKSVAEKLMTSPEFYNSLSKAQKASINDLAKSYGVDLENYKDLETAKLQFQAQILKQMAANQLKLIGSQITWMDVSDSYYDWQTAKNPQDAAKYKSEYEQMREYYLATKRFEEALNDIALNGVPYNPSSYSSNTSSSSSSEDKYKQAVDEKIALLKHQLAMEQITEEEYYNALEQIENQYYKNSAANMQKYAEEIRSIDEELFSGRRALFDSWLQDQEYRLNNKQGVTGLETQKDIYEEILNGILKQLDEAYKYGLKENSDYVQELKEQYHDYANDMVSAIKEAYDEIENYIDNFDLWDSVGLSKSEWYQFRLDELKKQYDQGLMYWEEYVNAYNEIAKNLYDVQKESIESIIEMTMDMIKQEAEDKVEALESQVEAYNEIISKKKELLQAGKEERDQEEAIREKVQEIAKLQSKIAQLSLDDSREAQSEKVSLEEELAQLQKELADLQGDYALDATIESLDKQQEAFEDQKQDEIDIIQDSVDSWAKLYQLAIDRIDRDWDGLYDDLMDYQMEYRDSIDGPDSLKTAWENASQAMQDYFGQYGSGSIEDVLGGLGGNTGIDPNVPNSSQAKSIVAQMYQNSIQALQSPSMAASLNAQNKKLSEQYKALTGQNLVQSSDNVWRLDNTSGQSVYEKYGFSENETIMGPTSKANPYSEGTAQYNSTGEAVKWIQYQLLKGLGYSNQTVTGQYGPITLQNVKKFQSTHGLSATGTVDSKTLKYLRAYHTGGIVDGTGAINDREVLAILEKNEMVLNDGKKYNLSALLTSLRNSLSGRVMNPISGISPKVENSGNTFAPNIQVNINHDGPMDNNTAEQFGSQIANVALGELRKAFVKRGI